MDALKIVSCIMVVLCHCVYAYDVTSDMDTWYKALYIKAFPRFGVPCFMIISSVNLYRKQYSIRKILRSRIPVFILLLIFWNLAYLAYNVIYGYELTIWREILAIPFKKQSSHLWYLYYITALYLISPLFVTFCKHTTKRQRLFLVSVFLLGKGILDYVLRITNYPFAGLVATGWNKFGIVELMFSILGITVWEYLDDGKIKWWHAIAGAVVGYGMIVFGNYAVFLHTASPPEDFFEHVSFPSILYGTSVFAFFYCIKDKFIQLSERIKAGITICAKITLGVFCFHSLIQSLIIKHIPRYKDLFYNYPAFSIANTLIVFVITMSICYTASYIRYLRKLIA